MAKGVGVVGFIPLFDNSLDVDYVSLQEVMVLMLCILSCQSCHLDLFTHVLKRRTLSYGTY